MSTGEPNEPRAAAALNGVETSAIDAVLIAHSAALRCARPEQLDALPGRRLKRLEVRAPARSSFQRRHCCTRMMSTAARQNVAFIEVNGFCPLGPYSAPLATPPWITGRSAHEMRSQETACRRFADSGSWTCCACRRPAPQRQRRTAPHHPRRRTTNHGRRTMRNPIIIAVATTATVLAVAGTASASVTIDATGKGFVGKGNVQTALGYNNSALQKAVDAKSLVFTAQQPTSQSLTQNVYAVRHPGRHPGRHAGRHPDRHAVRHAGRVAGSDLHVHQRQRHQDIPPRRRARRRSHRHPRRAAGSAPATASGTASATAPAPAPRPAPRPAASPMTSTSRPARPTSTPASSSRAGRAPRPYTETGAPVWNAPTFGAYTFGDYTFGDYTFGRLRRSAATTRSATTRSSR